MQTAPVQPLLPWFQTLKELTPQSFRLQDLFGKHQPVELDIGCGRGLFLVTAAVQSPDTNYLGLEIDYREGRRAATRLQKRDLPNARVIGGDSNRFLAQYLSPGSVDAAHVYFPDPWWKRKHHKRRLFTPQFLDLLARVVRPGGSVHSWTDVADYFELITELFDAHPQFQPGAAPEQRLAEHDMDYQTSFERKKRKLGLPIYRGLWNRL